LDWHLVFGPKRVLEYVVAHELTHLIERNHSEAFWRKLRTVFGDYEREHRWLSKNEHLLGYIRVPVANSTGTMP
jgi:predicted metal-dependent hydrolase